MLSSCASWIVVVGLGFWGAAGAAVGKPPVPAPAGQEWKLVWSDEFDGGKLDESKWHIPEYKRRDAHWSKRAIEVNDKGQLVIKTFQDNGEYYDGCVRTKDKFEQAFGYFEARIQLQKTRGHWPAFWLMGDGVNKVGNGGRDGTEIDIMEKAFPDDEMNHALHWDGYGKEHQSVAEKLQVPGIREGFHKFAMLWTPDEYVFFVDDKETWRTKVGGVCQVPLYIKLSDELEKEGWAGKIAEAKLPDEFVTDYVRVYDLVDKKTGKSVYQPKPIEVPIIEDQAGKKP